MNVKLLQKVKAHILADPQRLVMGAYAFHQSELGETFEGDDGRKVRFAKCGTAACIAGWACILDKDGPCHYTYHEFYEEAKHALGIADEQAEKLFYTPHWPTPFYVEYATARGQRGRAEVAARRIEHFIATGK